MGCYQNHSCMTQILNGGNSMNTLARGIHYLKALIEEIVISKYPNCLFYKLSPKGLHGISLIFSFFRP